MEVSVETYDLREAVDQALLECAEAGKAVAVVVADSTSTAALKGFSERFPERLINVGIAEQNMVGIAAGLSLGGFTVFTANAAPFLLSRSYEQVKNDLCYSHSNVKMLGLNAGVAYGPLGSTHHILDDISMLRGLGNLQIFAPSDAREAAELVRYVCSFDGPAYIRMDKGPYPLFHSPDYRFKVGKPDPIYRSAPSTPEVVFFSLGTILEEAYSAARILSEKGIITALYSLPSIRPLQHADLLEKIAGTRLIVTVEEHSVHGGLGALISGLIHEAGMSIPVFKVGFPEGIFVKAGPRAEIRDFYGLTGPRIVEVLEERWKEGEMNDRWNR
ncbi:MAG: transketolase family protein [Spirochaetales bacterium]|nr:transketolase family protein [Spirochaetales bacterium]